MFRGPASRLLYLIVLTISFLLLAASPRRGATFCKIGEKMLSDGEKLKTSDPCLECRCVEGSIGCRLKVCPRLPRPPPQSCLLLQKPNTCCSRLICPDGTKNSVQGRSNIDGKLNFGEGCILNGTLFGEGSAMVTSSLCEYCYCIKGKQHCVRPQCVLAVPGCTPEYSNHSCCPIKYNCSELNTTMTSTTKLPLTSTPTTTLGKCEVQGKSYGEGDRLMKMEKVCENCYCIKGKIRCEAVICKLPPVSNCMPVKSEGHCCPVSYNCSVAATGKNDTQPFKEMTTTMMLETTLVPTTTETDLTTLKDTTTVQYNDTEDRADLNEIDTATTEFYETTIIPDVSSDDTKLKVKPEVIEAIINRNLDKSEDYEYDYNEPSLPPSLPNLKIIPFVAADAVLMDNEEDPLYKSSQLKTTSPSYFDIPVPNNFNPPSETEGGFVPRDPMIDGPYFYQSKFDEVDTVVNSNLSLTSEPAKVTDGAKCKMKGRTYRHGQVVSEIKGCELCVCFFGEINCQKSNCGDEYKKSSLDRVKEDETTLFTHAPESMSNIPVVTVADAIATPDPFKDVIRTEPAPDLEHILKDMPSITSTTAKSVKTEDKPPLNTTDTDYDSFSFGSVFDYLFSNTEAKTDTSQSTSRPDLNEVLSRPELNSIVYKEHGIDRHSNITDPDEQFVTSTEVSVPQPISPNPIPILDRGAASGLLKLAGCNIYGKMYKVSEVIKELSSSCLECTCTEIGVQCKKIEC